MKTVRRQITDTLFNPVCNKYIGIMSAAVVSVTTENNFFTIGAKHRKCIEAVIPAYFFKPFPAEIGYIHIEWKTPRIFMIAAKNNMLTIGSKIRSPVCLIQESNLVGVAAICIGNKHLHRSRRYQPL